MSHKSSNYESLIRDNGYRLTPQRQIILDTLCAMGGHVSMGNLYEVISAHHPAIDRSTVYRGMDFFRELGLVRSSEVLGITVYELAHGGEEHGHLICTLCGRVEHVPSARFVDLADHVLATYGFTADLGAFTLHGLCGECNDGAAA